MKNNTMKIFLLFISFIILWFIIDALKLTVLWFVTINLIALYIIYRYKTFDKLYITMGIVFGILCVPSSFIMGISVILPYIASMMVFKNYNNKIFLFKNNKRNNIINTIVLIFVIGGILGGINVLSAVGDMPINISFKFKWIIDALRAGIFEEIFFRFFFFALCVNIIKNNPLSKLQNILCYAIMVIPHVLIHFSLQTFNIENVIALSLLFGTPFAFMQRKFNLVSAIGSHAFVDLVRFCIIGA